MRPSPFQKFSRKDCGPHSVKRMDKRESEELRRISSDVRGDVLRMEELSRAGRREARADTAALLVYLYWKELASVSPDPDLCGRDRFILGMPEAIPVFYATLARRGFFEREHLWNYGRLGAMLQAYPDFRRIPGMDAPCLTLQPSLSVALSLSGALYRAASKTRVLFLVSEKAFSSEEFAEEALRAADEAAPNLLMIIIRGSAARDAKRACAGWDCRGASAYDFSSLEDAFSSLDFASGAPKAIFAAMRGAPPLFEEPVRVLEESEVLLNEHR